MGEKNKTAVAGSFALFSHDGMRIWRKQPGETYRVQISIRCDNAVAKGLCEQKKWKGILPEDGVILPDTEVEVQEGDTVFDLLCKIRDEEGIQMEYNGGKGTEYIEGTGNLYEFDGGRWSGWSIASMVNTRIWDVASASWPMEMWSAGIIPVIWAWISMQICREHRSGWIRMSNRKGGRRSEISDEHNNVL